LTFYEESHRVHGLIRKEPQNGEKLFRFYYQKKPLGSMICKALLTIVSDIIVLVSTAFSIHGNGENEGPHEK